MNCCSFKVQFFSVLTFFASALIVQGQSGSPDSLGKVYVDWFNKSPLIDKVQGAEVSRAYQELLSGKQAKKKIIVAIIDSGVDTTHPDLSGRFWTNIDEIPGNGIDDDQNGYTDDIHGWGFLGNSKGENIKEENVEETRIYRQWDPVFKNVTNPANLDETAKKNFDLYMKARKAYEGGRRSMLKHRKASDGFEAKRNLLEVIKKYLGKPDLQRMN
ncbi:MAG: S8 family serine peptidase [Bacteroidales bacterium]